ncbi:hypothetical protein ACIQGA_32070 [[Kitasatospora] papulosa]|uniref:lipase/acyltransferase domain-containing protein n=1 Tax=Streptomyces TaxID=1883 RepID=UPI0030D229E0
MADVTHDAVVIVPGIMGSALADATSGTRLWGLEPGLLWPAWKNGMPALHLDADERAGKYGRVKAVGLLQAPAWAPVLHGFEPYGDLTDAVRRTVVHDRAVLEFAYDWRLPIGHNGRLLAELAHRHLTVWRTHEAHQAARDIYGDGRAAQLVFVCHSMGGLVTRAAFAHAAESGSSLDVDTRAVITLGTPFLGSAKTAVILNGTRANPSPVLPKGRAQARVRRHMQELAATLPGVHDLLPVYRCVDTGGDVRHLTPADVAAIGGNKDLATAALTFQKRIRGQVLPGHRQVGGVAQPTVQSVRVEAGVVHKQYEAFENNQDGELARHQETGIPLKRNRAGDGTVYRDAAVLPGTTDPVWLALQHGALAKDSFALNYVRSVLTEHDRDRGPALGAGGLGLDLPDSAPAGTPWTLKILPAPGDTLDTYAGIGVTVHDAATNRQVAAPRPGWRDSSVAARITLPGAGLYRIKVATGGTTPLTQLVLATDPATTGSSSDDESDAR